MIRWVNGKKSYKNAQVIFGRFMVVWAGWSLGKTYKIGSTRVVRVGPLAIFINKKGH